MTRRELFEVIAAILVLLGFVVLVRAAKAEVPVRIVWTDADALAFAQLPPDGQVGPPIPRYGLTRVTAPGEAGQPVAFSEPTSPTPPHPVVGTCALSQNGLPDGTGKWRCLCLGGRCNWNWIAPPPLVPCERSTTPRCQAGYCCAESIDGIAGWQGGWRAETR